MKTVMAALDGKVNKPGDWEELYNKEKKLLMVKYYDFDKNIRRKTVMSNVFVPFAARPHAAAVPVYDGYKAAFAFCDKYNNHPGDLGHQHNFALSCMLQNTFNAYFEANLVNAKSIDFRDNCLALADEIYACACTLKDQ